MNVIFRTPDGMDENPLPFADTRRVAPDFRLKFCGNGFAPFLGAEYNMNYVLGVGVGRVSHLRCLPFYTPAAQRFCVGLTSAAPTALENITAEKKRAAWCDAGAWSVERRGVNEGAIYYAPTGGEKWRCGG